MVDVVFVIAAAVLAVVGVVSIVVGLRRNSPTEGVEEIHTADEAMAEMLRRLPVVQRRADSLGGELAGLSSPRVADLVEARLRENPDFAIRILGGARIAAGPTGKHATYELWKRVGSSFRHRFEMRFRSAAEDNGEGPKHFAILDGETLVVEDHHKGHRWPRTLRTYRNSPDAVRRFEEFFESMWAAPDKVDKPRVVKCPGPRGCDRGPAEAE